MCGYHCRVCGYYLLSSKCSEPINPTRTGTCLCTHVPLPLCTYCLLLTGCAQEQLLSSDNSTLWRKPNKPPFYDAAWILFYNWKCGVPLRQAFREKPQSISQPLGHVGNAGTGSWKILLSLFHTVALNNEHIINVQSGEFTIQYPIGFI